MLEGRPESDGGSAVWFPSLTARWIRPNIHNAITSDRTLLNHLASDLLDSHFPISSHEDLLDAVGMQFTVVRSGRDPQFRESVLRAYSYRCGVCGFDGRIGRTPLAIEAALFSGTRRADRIRSRTAWRSA